MALREETGQRGGRTDSTFEMLLEVTEGLLLGRTPERETGRRSKEEGGAR